MRFTIRDVAWWAINGFVMMLCDELEDDSDRQEFQQICNKTRDKFLREKCKKKGTVGSL